MLSLAVALAIVLGLKFLGIEIMCAIVIAILVHETGHLLAICALGLKVKGFALELSGFRIEYSGLRSPVKDACSAFAGPFAGALFYLASKNSGDFIQLCGNFSLAYSLFNMIPMMPLDGGRVFLAAAEFVAGGEDGEKISDGVSFVLCLCFLAFAFYTYISEGSGAVLAVAIWLLILRFS